MMTTTEINSKIKGGTIITICPWTDAYSNQCLVRVVSVAGNRTVTYAWESLEGQQVEKTSQVSYSTWQSIVAQAAR